MLTISKKAKAKAKEKEKTRKTKAKAKAKEKRMKAELRRRREEERNEKKRRRMKREEARATLAEIYRTEDTVNFGGRPYYESCEDLSRKKNPKYDVFSPYESVFIYPHLPLLNRFDVRLTVNLNPTEITESIVGYTQFAIDTHNEGKVDDRVMLREVTKCNTKYLGRLWYYITFEGEDVGSKEVNMYHATVVVYVPSGKKELGVFRKAPKQLRAVG